VETTATIERVLGIITIDRNRSLVNEVHSAFESHRDSSPARPAYVLLRSLVKALLLLASCDYGFVLAKPPLRNRVVSSRKTKRSRKRTHRNKSPAPCESQDTREAPLQVVLLDATSAPLDVPVAPQGPTV